MSTYPTEPGQPSTYVYTAPPTNGLGIAGFVVSLSGLVVCLGLTCPIGLVLSLVALVKEPRGYAIAGSILGFIGTIFGGLVILVATGVIGAGLFNNSFYYQSPTAMAMDSAGADIDMHFMNNNDTLPDEATGNTIIASYIDEWGNTLKYEPTQGSPTNYTITSAGPDGILGNGDDPTQYYTAYNWNTPTAQSDPFDQIEDEEIDAAFGLAAQEIVSAFPPDSPLPTAEQVLERTDTLLDAWGNGMKYSPTDNPPYYQLESAGPDEAWGTEDDIKKSFYFAPSGETDGPL